jgi:hypothetical protein
MIGLNETNSGYIDSIKCKNINEEFMSENVFACKIKVKTYLNLVFHQKKEGGHLLAKTNAPM